MALVVVKRLSRNAASDECYTPCDQVLPILDYLDKDKTYYEAGSNNHVNTPLLEVFI